MTRNGNNTTASSRVTLGSNRISNLSGDDVSRRSIPNITAASARVRGGGPIIWLTPETIPNGSNIAEARRRRRQHRRGVTSMNTIALRRLLIRPTAVVIFGACLLQASSIYDHRANKNIPSNPKSLQRNSNAWMMGWGRAEEAKSTIPLAEPTHEKESSSSSASKNSSKSSLDITMMRSKQQIPAYPRSWMTRGVPEVTSNKSMDSPTESSEEAEDDSNPKSDISDGTPDNPQLYGWEPTIYPDPLHDPVRCGVAYISQDEQIHNDAVAEVMEPTTNIDNEADQPDSATVSPPPEAPPPTSPANRNKLRLCDPDWVLGGMYLEEIAAALHDFSLIYGDIVAKTRPALSPSASAADSNEGNQRALRQRLLNENLLRSDGDGIFLTSNRRMSLRSTINRRAQDNTTDDPEASIPEYQDVVSTEPTVQLAVATVRKVRLIDF